ncbi:MAG: hypothetical protein U0531_19850 [Dehalococcoidia bacterium]
MTLDLVRVAEQLPALLERVADERTRARDRLRVAMSALRDLAADPPRGGCGWNRRRRAGRWHSRCTSGRIAASGRHRSTHHTPCWRWTARTSTWTAMPRRAASC